MMPKKKSFAALTLAPIWFSPFLLYPKNSLKLFSINFFFIENLFSLNEIETMKPAQVDLFSNKSLDLPVYFVMFTEANLIAVTVYREHSY